MSTEAEVVGKAKHTPGPWQWFGSRSGVYLATTHSGRRFVMGFKRYGMGGAEPTFQINRLMVPASALVEFEVGDGNARGFKAGEADPSVYRTDIIAIDAPDARLIALSPEMYDLVVQIAELPKPGYYTEDDTEFLRELIRSARLLRSKAEGAQ